MMIEICFGIACVTLVIMMLCAALCIGAVLFGAMYEYFRNWF